MWGCPGAGLSWAGLSLGGAGLGGAAPAWTWVGLGLSLQTFLLPSLSSKSPAIPKF